MVSPALNVFLKFLLVPAHVCIVASLATIISELFIPVCVIIGSSKTQYSLGSKVIAAHLGKISFSAILFVLFVFCLSKVIFPLLAVFFSAIIYFVALYLVGGIDRDEIALFKGLIGAAQ